MKPFVMIELDKPRRIRFDTNALCEVEEYLKKPLSSIDYQKELGIKELRLLLWIGLKHEDKTLTLQKVGELMDLADYGEIGAKIAEALINAMQKTRSEGKEVEEKN